jgi:UDP-N-acetyl-D-mannosaminuronate dehydrogenase
MKKKLKSDHISIIGGAGHIGLPLALAFSKKILRFI